MRNLSGLGKFALLILLGLIFFHAVPASAYTYSGILRLGSKGSSVTSLQQALGIGADGIFGYGTRTAVVNFQIAHGLVADGVVGPTTGDTVAKSSAVSYSSSASSGSSSSSVSYTGGSSSYLPGCTAGAKYSSTTGLSCSGSGNPLIPPGCKSNTDYSEYSTTTGLPCASTPVYPAGCDSSYGYSTQTGLSCSLPIGCTSTDGYSPWSGLACDGSSPSLPYGCTSSFGYSTATGASCTTGISYGSLSGTSGSLRDVQIYGSSSGNYVSENSSGAWLGGYDISAYKGSDLAIFSIKVSLELTGGTASANLKNYANSVSITENGYTIGSADISDFSKDNGVYTKNIPISGSFIGADTDSAIYITVSTVKNISSSNADNTWALKLLQVGYRDATGSTITDSSTGAIGSDGAISFHFLPGSDDN